MLIGMFCGATHRTDFLQFIVQIFREIYETVFIKLINYNKNEI